MQLFFFYIVPLLIGMRFGGVVGAVLMLLVGYLFRRFVFQQSGVLPTYNLKAIQSTFYETSFSVMGYVAKADGKVSMQEIKQAEFLFDQLKLNAEQKQAAKRCFSLGKSADFSLQDALDKFKRFCSRPATLSHMFLEIQVMVAMADGTLAATERQVLERIREMLGLDVRMLEQLIARFNAAGKQANAPTLANCYQLLGVQETASMKEIKRAYRKQMAANHPDKLVSKGLPKEMIQIATEKTKQLSGAYERIKNARA